MRRNRLEIFRRDDELRPIARHIEKRFRRVPVLVPEGAVLSMSRWKICALEHWLSPAFRGRVSSGDYARLHGVSAQTVAWLMAAGRLGEVTRDWSGRRWVLADWPYPDRVSRLGGYDKAGVADPTVRALHYSDFVQVGRGPCPSAQALEDYCAARGLSQRKTLADRQRQLASRL